jgi:N-acetylglucosaminylphosphatidylinositol deacetylase
MSVAWSTEVISSLLKQYLEANRVDIVSQKFSASAIHSVLDHLTLQIITFDTGGITQHPNHTPLSLGVERLFRPLPSGKIKGQDMEHHRPRLFTLQTVPKYVKFTSVLYPVFETLSYHLWSRASTNDATGRNPALVLAITSPIEGYRQALQAMRQHRSQLVWFRWLYVAFSKYMWSNRLVEVDLSG